MADYPVIGGKPPPRRTVAHPWKELADHLKEHPNEDVLHPGFTDIPTCEGVAMNVNHKTPARPLRDLGGKVTAFIRNSTLMESGRRRGDVWFRWEPDEED